MKMTHLTRVALSLILVQACASLNKEECQTANWSDIGFKDGSLGESTTRFAKHSKACTDHGIQPNRELYDGGYQKGLRAYCTPQRGFELGKSGGIYGVTCPADLTATFNTAFERGKEWRDLNLRFKDLETRVTAMEDLADKEADMNKRQALRKESRALANDRDTARTKLLILESKWKE